MTKDLPSVDLSNGKYDALETKLSQWLGLKIMLVRGWQRPAKYNRNTVTITVGTPSEEEREQQRAAELAAESAMLASLRDNIVQRDAGVGHDLTERDLKSLMVTGHVTLRKGNTEPEQAVLIMDPAESPSSGPLAFALSPQFTNAWRHGHEDFRINAAGLIENFVMAAEDIRCYRAVQNVRYALQNQSEYNNLGRGWWYEPAFYDFAGISAQSANMDKSYYEMSFKEVYDRLKPEFYALEPQDLGIKDPAFFEKMKMAGAVHSLLYSSLDGMAFSTFARLYNHRSGCPSPEQINKIQQGLRKSLEKQLKSHSPDYDDFKVFEGLSDWRVLFPIFREVYEKDKSSGPMREYLNVVMEGLQKWFPTLTNGPVPDISYGSKEPPRQLSIKPAKMLKPPPSSNKPEP